MPRRRFDGGLRTRASGRGWLPWIAVVAAFEVACAGAASHSEGPAHQPNEAPDGGPSPAVRDDAATVEVDAAGIDADGALAGDRGRLSDAAVSAPTTETMATPREDPVPWRWVFEVIGEEEPIDTTGPLESVLSVYFEDLDGDGVDELFIRWSNGAGICNCEMRAAVAHRTEEGYRLISRFYGSIELATLPGGRRAVVNSPSDDPEEFDILVLRPEARRFATIFTAPGGYTGAPPVTCSADDGTTYESTLQGNLFFSEREGTRVLEEIREYNGCSDDAPPVHVHRVEDLLRRAGLAPE